MRISRRFKRIVSAMLATALAFTMTFSTDVMPLADSKQDQLKAEVSAKQAELDKVNAAAERSAEQQGKRRGHQEPAEEQKNLILARSRCSVTRSPTCRSRSTSSRPRSTISRSRSTTNRPSMTSAGPISNNAWALCRCSTTVVPSHCCPAPPTCTSC